MTPLDRPALRAELAATWLADLRDPAQRAEGERLIAEIVDDWAREADPMPDPAVVLRFQREDLDALVAGRDPAGRLDALRQRVVTRRVDRLHAVTYSLGRAILDGRIDDDNARQTGRELLDRCEQLAAEIDELPPSPVTAAARRALDEATMDALFAVERRAHSARLTR